MNEELVGRVAAAMICAGKDFADWSEVDHYMSHVWGDLDLREFWLTKARAAIAEIRVDFPEVG